jgi:predicted Zn-dependent protease with MMP-like domain
MRERRGSIAGALILAAFVAGILSPVAAVLSGTTRSGMALWMGAIAVAAFVPLYALTALIGRDAEKLRVRGEARRAHAAQLEAAFAAAPLPFTCDAETFDQVVGEEAAALPPWVRHEIEATGTAIHTADQLEESPFVLGLFSRRPVGQPGLVGGGATLDTVSEITLYRIPLIRASGAPGRFRAQIRETLLHEVGHLLGMSELDLDRYTIGNHPLPDATPVRPRR